MPSTASPASTSSSAASDRPEHADPAALAAFIGDQRTEHHVPHRLACRVLGVSGSWFYKWRDRPTTAREVRRGQPADAIRQIFENSGGTYGSPKVWLLLIRAGWRVWVNTVVRLMAELGLAGRKIRRRGGLTRSGKRPVFADFVRRDFTADAPDQVWCGDMTEIATGEGKLYLATVIDLFSRRLLGYAMGARHDAELVVASLNMAAATRGGDVKGVIFHSDRGSEYVSRRFRWACRRLGVTQSTPSGACERPRQRPQSHDDHGVIPPTPFRPPDSSPATRSANSTRSPVRYGQPPRAAATNASTGVISDHSSGNEHLRSCPYRTNTTSPGHELSRSKDSPHRG
ncbi:IS3 family transposase [Streptomyces sp. NBC_00365]|nr:IS3 family transposase [Streptomyces sp. NBC_00365]MCX5097312.1 IS3 family transposase [Streptomyces sp. NBC_00365]